MGKSNRSSVTHTPEVVVVGAGVIGCAVAHELARRGARVHVVDRRDVGQGATQASAGVLAPYTESPEGGSLRDLGARSLALYDEFVARVVEDSGSTIQYVRTGTLEVATDSKSLTRLQALGASCSANGIDVEYLDAAGAREAEPQLAERVCGGLLVPAHGFVGAADLTGALRRAAGAHGVTFSSSTSVARVSGKGDGLRVETAGEVLTCDGVVLAAGSWSGQVEVEGAQPVPVRPVRGQLLHLGWPTSRLARVVWARQCYLVPWTDGSVLAGATVEDVGFDERATVAGVEQLLDVAREIAPKAGEAWFRSVRVGLRPGTPDELPVIGPSTSLPGLVYATGHYRSGILLAPLTASLVASLMLEHSHDPALEITAPSRFGAC